jgi:hypothetical protein
MKEHYSLLKEPALTLDQKAFLSSRTCLIPCVQQNAWFCTPPEARATASPTRGERVRAVCSELRFGIPRLAARDGIADLAREVLATPHGRLALAPLRGFHGPSSPASLHRPPVWPKLRDAVRLYRERPGQVSAWIVLAQGDGATNSLR